MVLSELSVKRPMVATVMALLLVAGGIVAEPATFSHLLERFHTVWVRTTPHEHMQRVRLQGDHRPMQGNPAAMQQLNALLDQRTPLYEKAEAQLDTSGKTERSSLASLLAVIDENRFLSLAG